MGVNFKNFRDIIIQSLDKYEVSYKLFGGAVICLIDKDRLTEDLDIAIIKNTENADMLIKALVDCGYCDEEFLTNQVYGIGVSKSDEALCSTCRLETTNKQWEDFHIDLCFNLGQYSYETMPEEIFNDNGLELHIVPLKFIASMKANIFPQPRPKDIEDIIKIAAYLGLDPATGQPIEKDKGKLKLSNIFGGVKK